MKKYHIADMLTLLRAIIGVAILSLTFLIREPITGTILILFAVGELTDALDGEFARRYKYPRDGIDRWWRRYNDSYDLYQYELNDIYADLIIGIATLIYIIRWVDPLAGGVYFGAMAGIGLFVLMTTESQDFRTSYRYETIEVVERIREHLILRRRRWYAWGLAIITLTLIVNSEIAVWVKIILVLLGIFVGIYLVELKRPTRLKEDKTPL